MPSPSLLDEIEAYIVASGYSPSYFGMRACGQPYLVERLRGGGCVLVATAEKIRGWMKAHPAEDHRKGSRFAS